MRRISALLGLFLLSFLAVPPAQAGEVAPVVEFDGAWLAGGGAAVEVAYVVSCPDVSDAQHPEYRHAMWTNGHYLEFRCGPEPRRVKLLLPGEPPAKNESMTFTTRVVTPQCLYWPSSELPNGEQGCWKVDRTDTVRQLKLGSSFVPESSVDLGLDIRVDSVELTGDGGVRLTAELSCATDTVNTDGVTYEVRQMTRAGYTSSVGFHPVGFCTPGEPLATSAVVYPAQANRPFVKGDVVVSLDWTDWPEGGPWAFHTGLHRVR